MGKYKNPVWWTPENDTAWERVKTAVQRDWDQTKHDFGGNEPDTNQQVSDTLKQAAGKEPIPPRQIPTFEEVEPAYRFGYGAQLRYGKQFSVWNGDLDSKLEEDWERTYPGEENAWSRFRPVVRRGWELEVTQKRSGVKEAPNTSS